MTDIGQSDHPSTAGPPGASATKSFKTNVNRQKSRRWVEAKTYAYDGDDWGDADEYDDYQAPQQQQQPPAPRTTGIRQRGQSVDVSAPATSSTEGSPATGSYAPFQNIEQRPGWRDARHDAPMTVAHPQSTSARTQSPVSSPRSPSGHYPEARVAPTRVSQMDRPSPGQQFSVHDPHSSSVDSSVRNRQASEPWPSRDLSPLQIDPASAVSSHPAQAHREQQAAYPQNPSLGGGSGPQSPRNTWSAVDVPPRQDPPSAGLPDHHQSPAHSSAEQSTPGSATKSFPPRKSSLSLNTPGAPDSAMGNPRAVVPATPPSREMSPPAAKGRDRSASNRSQTRPFIRPADIYKRMEEERAKEGQRSESTRRSVDSVSSRSVEADAVAGLAAVDGRRSSESTMPDDEAESSRRARSKLDPVRERQGEYGMEGLLGGNRAADADPAKQGAVATAPLLPDVARLSGFGDGLWATSMSDERTASGAAEPRGKVSDVTTGSIKEDAAEPAPQPPTPLHHQTSPGFGSVVHHPFDQPPDNSVAAGPSSAGGKLPSENPISPQRSDNSSTAAISPILSHSPSATVATATAAAETTTRVKQRDASASDNAITPITEELTGDEANPSEDIHTSLPNIPDTRPAGSGTVSAQDPDAGSSGPSPPSFQPGHRRDLSIPSSSNSPPRSPNVDVKEGFPPGEAAMVPVAGSVDHVDNLSQHDMNQAVAPVVSSTTDNAAQGGREDLRPTMPSKEVPQQSFVKATVPSQKGPTSFIRGSFPPLHGRVRDLAGRFEPGSRSRSPSPPKPRPGELSDRSQAHGAQGLQRPSAPDRDPSFRPVLPGGWVSYAPSVEGGAGSATPEEENPNPLGPDAGESDAGARVGSRLSIITTQPDHADANEQTFSKALPEPSAHPQSVGSMQPGQADSGHTGSYRTSPVQVAPPGESTSYQETGALTVRERRLSGGSSVPPTPPPKDSPLGEAPSGTRPDYYTTPLVPRKRSPDPGLDAPQQNLGPDGAPILSDLSTDNSPHDQESDKLRKEIVKSLNFPELSARTAHPNTWNHYEPGSTPRLEEPEVETRNRESTALPAEYDSYWASAEDPAESSPARALPVTQEQRDTRGLGDGSYFPPRGTHPTHEGGQALPSASDPYSSVLGPDKATDHASPSPSGMRALPSDQSVLESPPVPPPHHQPLPGPPSTEAARVEDVGPGAKGDSGKGHLHSDAGQPLPLDVERRDVIVPSNEPAPLTDLTAMSPETQAVESDGSPYGAPVTESQRRASGPQAELLQTPPPPRSSEDSPAVHLHDNSKSRAETPASVEHGDHKAEEVPSVSVMDRPAPDNWDQARATATEFEEGHGQSTSMATVPVPTPAGVAVVSGSSHETPKPLGFHEISALKTPQERIRAFNAARLQFANGTTGLANWLTVVRGADTIYTGTTAARETRRSMDGSRTAAGSLPRPGTSNSGTAGGSGSAPTQQQPYYQQYLNFSDLSPSTQGSTAGPARTAGTSSVGPIESTPSSSGGGGRISTHQMQAKGKDLLHSAGILGGKANVAAKGLFSKGKSKFRASTGDKGDH